MLDFAEMPKDKLAAWLRAADGGAIGEWNRYRGKNVEWAPDLNGANLAGANLEGAFLEGADLDGADLRKTYLRWANLRGAILDGADLVGAKLEWANLEGAFLEGANLAGAVCHWTAFINLDLSRTLGLNEIRHNGPSSIGTDTLSRSNGRLPDAFLRGCGLKPWEVTFARIYDPDLPASDILNLTTEAFRQRTEGPIFIGGVFISYSHDDADFADKVYNRLSKTGANAWLDRHDAVAGPLARQVVDSIRLHDIVLLVLSKSSIDSDWVDYELEKALQKEVDEARDVLCPVALDDAWEAKTSGPSHWRRVREKLVLDFSDPEAFDAEFDKLLEGLKKYYPPK